MKRELFKVTKDGQVDYNYDRDFRPNRSEEPDQTHHGLNSSSSEKQKEDNIFKELIKSEDKDCDASEGKTFDLKTSH